MLSFYRAPIRLFCGVFLLSMMFWIARPARAQVVAFPDPALETAVRNALGIFSPTNIYRTNLASVTFTNFTADNAGIRDLTGIEYATNLTVLEIRGSFGGGVPGLTNIAPLAQLRKLIRLDIAGNQFTNASSLAGLTNLVFLDVGWNRDSMDTSITDTTFLTNLRKLQWLSLFYLRIQNLGPVATLTTLTNLTISYNYAATNATTFSALTNMVEFYAASVTLNAIPFVSQMPLLRRLDITDANVTNLAPVLGLGLQALYADRDPLAIPQQVTNLTSLNVLHMNGTGLTNASSFTRLTALTDLAFDANPGLTNLSFVSSLTNLTYLSAGQLTLSNLGVFSSLRKLTEIHLHDDTNLTSVAPILGLTNLTSLDLNNCPLVNFATVTNFPGLQWLYLDSDNLQSVSFVLSLTNLYGLSLNNNLLTSLDSLAGAHLGQFNVSGNRLGDVSALLPMTSIYYLDIRNNYLDINPGTTTWTIITNIQARFMNQNYNSVDYSPQSRSTTLSIFDQPAQQCVLPGSGAYFAVSASTTAGLLRVQWQFNNVDLAGQTNLALTLSSVSSNQAGFYRALLLDDNGGVLSDAARLFVGDTNCGLTIAIQQQPLNVCAAAGEDVAFTVAATSTLTNLYYQWQFNGTNIAAATNSELDLFSVNLTNAGFYRVQLWDNSSNVVTSASAQLKVVDRVAFTDPALSNLVFQALGLASGSQIHLTNLDNLSALYVANSGITNISGLECARNLNSVDLSGNAITNADALGWDYQLGYLNLDNCGLQDASFVSTLTNLYDLELGDNQIHSIPVMDGLANLNYLRIDRNGCLINFPRLASLTNLLQLSLHSDCLPDINFASGMRQLQTLDVGADYLGDPNRSYISDVSPLTGKTNINWLSLTWNMATNVPVIAPFTNMTYLYLSANPFRSLSFITNMPSLMELTINYSLVTNLAPITNHSILQSLDVGYIATSNLTALSGLTNLTSLSAGGNNAGSASMLSGIKKLTSLNFELNAVADISPLSGMTNLSWLQLENNVITNISALAARTNLQNLYLSGNRIHDLTPLSGDTNVNSLSLSANGFTNVSALASLYRLNWLVMQSNHIQNISPLANLTNLMYALDVSANEITDISPVTNLHALTFLGAWQNKLTRLPSLIGLSSITSLDFWGNQLTNVSGVSGMTQLTWLGLSRNNLTTVQALSGLPNLGTIDLYTNLLTDISGVSGLTNLTWLNANENNLQDIHSLTNLTHLNYAGLLYNLLDTNTASAAMANIAVMQGHGTYVDYIPQKISSSSAPLLLNPIWLGANQFRFTIQGLPSTVLQIYTSTNLTTWSTGNFVTNITGSVIYTDSPPAGPKRFYRALKL